jgi:predicted metalloprotease with PDZ domain
MTQEEAAVPRKSELPIRYALRASDPKGHYVDVEVRVPPPHPDPLTVAMPSWTPGSYKVRDFARHVLDFSASDGRGRRLEWLKRDKQTWEIYAAESAPVVIRYRVYANELGVRTSHLDDRHGHLNGAGLFLYAHALMSRPCELHLEAPRGWRVVVPLRGERNRYLAPDYDALVDAPVEMGELDVAHFRERGVPHRVVICGQGETRAVDLVPDLQKIVRAGAAMFGGLPYREYVFLLHLAREWGGGLEHAQAASLVVARDGFSPREKLLDFLQLAAHEHFHAWNVKRLRPEALGPFDYARENYTRMLWVAEGWTSYYERLLLRRARLMTAQEMLDRVGEKIRRLRETPGRAVQSLVEASFDAWIKYYQPNENSPNATISYYDKGQLVALLLDLEIRRRSRGRRSLDDALRLLYKRHGEGKEGYADSAVRTAAEEVAGGSLRRFFLDYVEGTEELDFDSPLADFGLELRPEADGDVPRADLGAILEKRNDRAVIATVLAGGPAAQAGLDARDEIVAWNGVRVDREGLERRLDAQRPGDRVELTVFRADLLRTLPVALGRRGPKKLRIAKMARAGRAAKELYRGWLGEKF